MTTTLRNKPAESSFDQDDADGNLNRAELVAAALRRNIARDELRKAARSNNTRIAYDKAWQRFTRYCRNRQIRPQEARTHDITDFFIQLGIEPLNSEDRILAIGTLKLYRSALNRRYAENGCESPAAAVEVGDVLAGLARLRNETPRQVKALREYEIKAMLDACPTGRFGRRDAAMLALGFGAALRRSELCALLVSDIDILHRDKMMVFIRRSKTDQSGAGQRIAVPNGRTITPVSLVQKWLEVTDITDGHLFQTFHRGGRPTGRPLSHSEVPRLVKKYAEKTGLDPAHYSGHSLRAGFVTSAAVHGARLDKIMEVTRHKNPATVMKYIRDANAFEQHAGAGFL